MVQALQALPSNYYYSGMDWVVLLLFIVLFLVVLTFYFIGRKKECTYKKRGFVIGLIIVIIWLLIEGTGTLTCNWNPVEGSVVPSGICKNLVLMFIFYIPTMIATFPALILGGLFIDQLDLPGMIVSPILIIL